MKLLNIWSAVVATFMFIAFAEASRTSTRRAALRSQKVEKLMSATGPIGVTGGTGANGVLADDSDVCSVRVNAALTGVDPADSPEVIHQWCKRWLATKSPVPLTKPFIYDVCSYAREMTARVYETEETEPHQHIDDVVDVVCIDVKEYFEYKLENE